MPDLTHWGIFLTAALLLAITPGPGIFYVLSRSIRGGRQEGVHSSLGTAVGGLVHVMAAALGISAILASSAIAFLVVKYAGAAYLIYLGITTIRQTDKAPALENAAEGFSRNAFHQGITTEVLNPKTALFFLAFIPQFVNPAGNVALQFLLLGSISVSLNTLVDLVVATLAGPIGQRLRSSVRLRRRQQQVSGGMLVGLGLYVALADAE
ncbi:LysE family translocator [Nodosilinea sp. LEGE 07088]|uniref:LysE family translocator n=1 Tax=Nodosilinea sp. LEGE 07088 TaxID=2777968 RepID=UPI001881CD07|nr:LysE family translocator [Nodosilinea sp. LEGE 07088]MBE9139966.1 LysE family translocator [Nodosilinea sp. LEGE 07088]